MAWDTAAQNMAVNVIAKVESSGAWDAINYSDPITVGLMQWYGTRAAALLDRIRDEGTGWVSTGALATLDSQLDSQSLTSRWWTTRYLTGDEGRALKPILRANHAAQAATINDDIDDYRAAASRIGMNPDTNTNAVIFFCIMYHQTPARAIRIVRAAGINSSIDRIYTACMNDKVFRQYKTRYTQAVNIIKSGVPPTLIDLNDDDAPGGDNGGGNDLSPDNPEEERDPTQQLDALVSHLTVAGDQIIVHLNDGGQRMIAVPTTANTYKLSGTQPGRGEAVPDTPEDTGEPPLPPPTGDMSARQKVVRDWALAHLGAFGYTNDSRRVDIEASGWGDCSAFTRAAYKQVGVRLGLLTSSQYTQGTRVTSSLGFSESQLQVGDLIYIQWANPRWNSGKVTDHVEIYIGNNTLVGHPGPGRGGRKTPLNTYRTLFRKVWIQRHIK